MEAIDRFWDVSKLLTRDTKIKPEAAHEFDDDTRAAVKDYWLTNVKILIIGAGGLGCELLKNLAMLGIKNIDIVDLDTIDVTNLNRQFLFRKKDIGKYKSQVAADFVKARVPGCNITPHTKKIQEFNGEFYSQFHIYIAGLDNIEARRWLNQMVHSLVQFDENFNPDPMTQKAIVDGGTESFSGQARVIIPYKTACFDCTLGTMSNSNVFNFCTIAETPRIPEHCIAYVMLILWDKFWNSPENLASGKSKRDYDTDSEEDMRWIYERSLERAKDKGIEGVTYNLTLGVVKNIIPAIASTNAIISAACASETLKLLTYCSMPLDNWFSFNGKTTINCNVFPMERLENCPVCNTSGIEIEISRAMKVKDLISALEERLGFKKLTVVTCDGQYFSASGVLAASHEWKQEKLVGELVNEGLLTTSGAGAKINVYSVGIEKTFVFLPSYIC